jgi:hypothetical protein
VLEEEKKEAGRRRNHGANKEEHMNHPYVISSPFTKLYSKLTKNENNIKINPTHLIKIEQQIEKNNEKKKCKKIKKKKE